MLHHFGISESFCTNAMNRGEVNFFLRGHWKKRYSHRQY